MTTATLAREHLLAFLRALNECGLTVPAPKQADFLLALTASPPGDVESLYWRGRVTLVTASDDLALFDTLFDAFFRGGRLLLEEPLEVPPDAEGETPAPQGGDDGELAALEPKEGSGLGASPLESTGTRAFAAATGEERETLREIAAAVPAALPACRARRLLPARRGARLDLQRVLHAANRSGGEVLHLAWRRRPARARRVLLLIDVSGSMRAHTPELLRFAHELVRGTERAEAFTFGTRLTRVTSALDTPDVDRALEALSDAVLDADGGTRIGVALQQLLADRRFVALTRGALIIVLSDGLERGDPSAMGNAAHRLARLGHRLVWWSPLACDPGYRPVTRGMRAILGELDALSGARDLTTLLRELRGLPDVEARGRRTAIRAWAS